MVRELFQKKGFTLIHAITKEGGAGKSKFNSTNKTIYERIDYNLSNTKKGLATSFTSSNNVSCQKFGPLGLLIVGGKINNVNRFDAGSTYNDDTNLWESTEGIDNPSVAEVIVELDKTEYYAEVNIYDYQVGGFFLDLDEINWLYQNLDGALDDFYKATINYELPYLGFYNGCIIQINHNFLKINDWDHIQNGQTTSLMSIY